MRSIFVCGFWLAIQRIEDLRLNAAVIAYRDCSVGDRRACACGWRALTGGLTSAPLARVDTVGGGSSDIQPSRTNDAAQPTSAHVTGVRHGARPVSSGTAQTVLTVSRAAWGSVTRWSLDPEPNARWVASLLSV
jgi:hypothetical protein